jgi:hypothetical protein
MDRERFALLGNGRRKMRLRFRLPGNLVDELWVSATRLQGFFRFIFRDIRESTASCLSNCIKAESKAQKLSQVGPVPVDRVSWLEEHRSLSMDLLKEHKKAEGCVKQPDRCSGSPKGLGRHTPLRRRRSPALRVVHERWRLRGNGLA